MDEILFDLHFCLGFLCQEGMNGRTLPCNKRLDENGYCASCDKKGKATSLVRISSYVWLFLAMFDIFLLFLAICALDGVFCDEILVALHTS